MGLLPRWNRYVRGFLNFLEFIQLEHRSWQLYAVASFMSLIFPIATRSLQCIQLLTRKLTVVPFFPCSQCMLELGAQMTVITTRAYLKFERTLNWKYTPSSTNT